MSTRIELIRCFSMFLIRFLSFSGPLIAQPTTSGSRLHGAKQTFPYAVVFVHLPCVRGHYKCHMQNECYDAVTKYKAATNEGGSSSSQSPSKLFPANKIIQAGIQNS